MQKLFFLLFAFLFLTNSVAADLLLLKNGDRLTGTVIKKDEGTVVFKTEYAGDLNISWNAVAALTTDAPAPVILKGGRLVEASKFSNTPADGGLVLSKVAVINPSDSERGGWDVKGNVNTAMKFERGNNDTDELDFDGMTEIRTKHNRFTLRGAYEYDEADDTKTTDKWKGSAKHDYFLNKRLYVGALISSESDTFADLKNRTIGGPHIGYQFYEEKRMNLSADISGARVREEFQDGRTDYYFASGWTVNFDYYIVMDALQFYHRHGGLLNVDDTDKYLVDAYTGFRWPIAFGFVGSVEHQFEHDSEPAASADRNDNIYNIKIGYQW